MYLLQNALRHLAKISLSAVLRHW